MCLIDGLKLINLHTLVEKYVIHCMFVVGTKVGTFSGTFFFWKGSQHHHRMDKQPFHYVWAPTT
jgi:hypothetical protein